MIKTFEKFDENEDMRIRVSARRLTLYIRNTFNVECKMVSDSLITDYIFRNKNTNTKDELLGIKITLEDLPLTDIEEYIANINKIKIFLEGLELSHGKGQLYAFFKRNDKITNLLKSDKIVKKI